MFRSIASSHKAALCAVTLSVAAFGIAPIAHAQTIIPAANRITANDGATNDEFGIAVALSGNVALVGARSDDIGGNTDQGSAYLFDIMTGTQTAKLTASDGSFLNGFGEAVALSGNTALIGASVADFMGAAYLFNATTGVQTAKLTASDRDMGDFFGGSVALSGNTALIGAYGDTIGTKDNQGSAYLFNATTGVQTAKLVASDGAAEDYFGASVALTGNIALVGAIFDNIGANFAQGSVYLFNATTGAQLSKLVASDGAANDQFGSRISVFGNFALVGAFGDDIGANINQGSAYLFDITTGTQLFKFVASDGAAGDQLGSAVAISGNTALIGALTSNINGNVEQGSVYAFDVLTGVQIAKFTTGDGTVDDLFGTSVALDGNNAIAGAAYDDIGANTNQGSAYRFTVTNSVVAAPEPGSVALVLSAVLGVAGFIVRRNASVAR